MSKFKRLAEVALQKDRVDKVLRAQQQFENEFDKNCLSEYHSPITVSKVHFSMIKYFVQKPKLKRESTLNEHDNTSV